VDAAQKQQVPPLRLLFPKEGEAPIGMTNTVVKMTVSGLAEDLMQSRVDFAVGAIRTLHGFGSCLIRRDA
jgi:hypothetical protein